MSGQQQHQPQRYGHSYGHHSHAHSQAYAHSHHHDADPDNHGGMDGYADIDDEMAMLGYHHPGGPSPLDDYHYPDRPAVADAGPTHGQYQQRLIYLQQHQHQQRAAAAAAAAQAQAQAHAAASACGPPPEHAQPNGWHSHAQLHLHHHHPPGYGRHLHSHVAAAAAATARCAPYPPQPARRSVTGSPVLANDQRQHQMHTLKGSAVPAASPTAELAPTNGTDARSHRSSSQRSGHFAHRSPSASASSTSAQVAPPASARTQHALAHNHHPLPRRPRVHHASDSAISKSAQAPTSITPNQSPAISCPLDPTSSASESNGYQPSGSGSGSGGRSSSGNSSARSPRTTRATRAAESRSTAAHEGSATSTDSSSSADLARVPASTTSSSGSSSTNTKSQSATSSAPETVPEPPVPPPQQLPAAQGKRVRAGNEPAAGQVQPAGGLASATKQSVPPAALQLTKDRAWAQSVIEHVSDMVLSLAPNGTIVWASPSARKVIGFNAAELAGRHLGEFVHPEDAQLLTRTLTASIAQSTAAPTPSNTPSNGATGTPRDSSFDVTVRFRRKNADYFLIHVTGRALLVSNSAATAAPEYPGLMTSPASATFASSTQPFAPQPQPLGIPAAPGIGLHPFSLPYNPGNLMAAAAALATASPLHTFPTATPAAASRPPPLLVAICREYPLGDHANQLDEVVGLRFENEMLREKLAAGYARRGTSPPVDSSLRRSVGGEVGIKLTEIVLPAANGVATEGHRVSVPVGAGDGAGAATSVGKKGMSAAVVPSDILRVAVERGVVPRAGAAAAAVDAAGEGDGEEADGTEGAGGKARGKAKKKRKLNGIKPSDERVCIDCGVTSSSEWRKGPMGAKTLCNACGLRYAKRKKDEAAARARAMADQASTSASSTDPLTSGLDAASSSTNSTSPPATASMLAESSASSTPPAPSGSHADQAMDTTGG